MKNIVFTSRVIASSLALAAPCAPFASFAQSVTLKPVVVTATRSATAADELVSDISVINRSAIEHAIKASVNPVIARSRRGYRSRCRSRVSSGPVS